MKQTFNYAIACALIVASACSPGKTTVEESNETVGTEQAEDKSKRPSPPAIATADINGVNVTIDYSSPAVKGREVWGNLVPFDKVWRTGANEANVLTVDADVMINDKLLPAGQYSLFTIPGQEQWTVIVNKVANQWGAYDYEPSEDVLRLEVMPEQSEDFQERLSFSIDNDGQLVFAWENLTFALSVSPATQE